MELTVRDFERIPRANLHVPVQEFARLWWTAERRGDSGEAAGLPEDAYLTGVQVTCRWLASAIVTVQRPGGPTRQWAHAPITGASENAYEELVELETQAAEGAVAQSGAGQPGFEDGALATLAWAWRRSGVPPIEVDAPPAKQTG
ncbi:hypothetical protein PWY87_16300 [Kribbella solani]|uniref:hypothetical protein n=1 Tax=Kribbella solani TaxID=236067 RepID=UPI0029AA514B|nr:hypothetical protein [Kribbella solani]MDX3003253.1 hypothetical protein [Kribbella solani]